MRIIVRRVKYVARKLDLLAARCAPLYIHGSLGSLDAKRKAAQAVNARRHKHNGQERRWRRGERQDAIGWRRSRGVSRLFGAAPCRK